MTAAVGNNGVIELRRSARSGAVGLAGAVVNGGLGFLLAVVVTRGFGPAGAGALFVVMGLVTVAGVACCLGADTALVWALPRREPGRNGGTLRLVLAAAVPGTVLAVLVAGAGFSLAPALAPVLVGTAADDPGGAAASVDTLRFAFAAVPLAVGMTLVLAAVRGLRPVGGYVGLQLVLLPAARPVLIGAAALAGGGILAGAAGFVAPMLVVLLAGGLLVLAPLGVTAGFAPAPVDRGWWRPGWRDWRTVWGFALPRAGSAAIDSGSLWVGVWLTAGLAGQAQAGIFGAVGRYALAGLVALHGMRVAVAPQLSRLLGEGRSRDAAAVHRLTTGAVIVLAWPVYLLLAGFSPAFLSVFGAEFTAGAAALTVLAAAMLVSTGLGNVQTLLLMSGRSGWHLAAASAGLATTVGLGLLLIPPHGALGAAIAWGCGITVENLAAAGAAYRAVRQPLVTRRLLLTAAAVAAAVGGAGAVGWLCAGRGVAGLTLALCLLAGIAVALAGRGRVRGQIRAAIALLLNRRRSNVDDT